MTKKFLRPLTQEAWNKIQSKRGEALTKLADNNCLEAITQREWHKIQREKGDPLT